MCRNALVLALLGGLTPAGCKSPQLSADMLGETKPALLVGPEAISKAPAPVELPAKEAARLCLRTAQELEKNEQTEDAIRLYEKARTQDAGVAKAAGRRLAVLYDKAGDFSKSAAEYEALVKATPKDADVLNDYGYSHYCRGDWASAEGVLLRAVQADPNHKRAWVNLGLAQAQLGKWDDSFQAFCKAVRPVDAHCNLGFVLAARGNTDEAKDQYRRALALEPGSRLAHLALAQLDNPQRAADRPTVADGTNPLGPGGRPRREKGYDPVEAAAKVPSIQELEARMKLPGINNPIVVSSSDIKTETQK